MRGGRNRSCFELQPVGGFNIFPLVLCSTAKAVHIDFIYRRKHPFHWQPIHASPGVQESVFSNGENSIVAAILQHAGQRKGQLAFCMLREEKLLYFFFTAGVVRRKKKLEADLRIGIQAIASPLVCDRPAFIGHQWGGTKLQLAMMHIGYKPQTPLMRQHAAQFALAEVGAASVRPLGDSREQIHGGKDPSFECRAVLPVEIDYRRDRPPGAMSPRIVISASL